MHTEVGASPAAEHGVAISESSKWPGRDQVDNILATLTCRNSQWRLVATLCNGCAVRDAPCAWQTPQSVLASAVTPGASLQRHCTLTDNRRCQAALLLGTLCQHEYQNGKNKVIQLQVPFRTPTVIAISAPGSRKHFWNSPC